MPPPTRPAGSAPSHLLAALLAATAPACAMGIAPSGPDARGGPQGDDVVAPPDDDGVPPFMDDVVTSPDDVQAASDAADVPSAVDDVPAVRDVPAAVDSCAARAEVCNGVDDNCNGTADEGFACVSGSPARACTTACGTHGTQRCASDCTLTACAPPAESCNLADDDCNGRCDDLDGCRTPIVRALNSTTGAHFYTTSASEGACCGYHVESTSAFWLYAAPTPGTTPFYRCYSASADRHFYTTSSTCEGSGYVVEGTLGYIGTSPACGATPLYRLAKGSVNDHFYTTSESERDYAVSIGYVVESMAGYAWTAGGG